MRYKWIYGILTLFVSALMLMPSVLASPGPPVWINQATLSVVDGLTSQDPENSGFGAVQVTVWEEWNGLDWDIYMSSSNADGALGSWVFPPFHPATTPLLDEINPAVAVTNVDPIMGLTEIHVVYQRWSPAGGGQWDICHTYTTNFGLAWTLPVVLDANPILDAKDPAIVYTEDLATTTPLLAMLVQFVWSEIDPISGFYGILYDAFYFDTVQIPIRGYVGWSIVIGGSGSCEYPEIASVDETLNGAANDFYFAFVWQEPTMLGQINVWYIAGTTITSPGAPVTMFNPGSYGQLNPVNPFGDSYHPDISATQDYNFAGPVETYYFHVNWVYNIWIGNTFQIDSCYAVGAAPTPVLPFTPVGAPARGPVNFILDNPTIATKLITSPVILAIFETWMCWEDNNPFGPPPPNIWYRVGQFIRPPFAYTVPAARVPYVSPLLGSLDYNPELWNRNDFTRWFPPLTHLVFDMTQLFGAQEVEYIDP